MKLLAAGTLIILTVNLANDSNLGLEDPNRHLYANKREDCDFVVKHSTPCKSIAADRQLCMRIITFLEECSQNFDKVPHRRTVPAIPNSNGPQLKRT